MEETILLLVLNIW